MNSFHHSAILTRTIVVLTFSVMMPGHLSALAQHGLSIISEEKRNQWIQDAIAHLRTITPDDMDQEITFYMSNRLENYVQAFRVYGYGYVRFGDEDWVCILTHSSHADGAIGDVILARNKAGDIYEIKGHICGGVAFFLGYSMNQPANSAEFFRGFSSDARDSQWRRIAGEDSK